MPVGPFKTFDECVSAQEAKGQDTESARKICGEIEKRTIEGESHEAKRARISPNSYAFIVQ